MELEIINKDEKNKIKSFESGDIFMIKQPVGYNEEYTQIDGVATHAHSFRCGLVA